MPFAPGTFGSVPAVVIFAIAQIAGISVPGNALLMATIIIIASAICVICTPEVSGKLGKKDPGEIVIDEVAGQAVTFLAVGAVARGDILPIAIVGFVLFRFFDILKPWPIKKVEKLPQGWGVLLDDVLAGIYAALVLVFFKSAGVFDIFSGGFCIFSGDINVISSVFLGVVQGVTEFLPVSSSGHLVLFETIFDYNPETSEMLLFDLVTHLGTLMAIVVVFGKSFRDFAVNLAGFRKYGPGIGDIYRKSPSVHILTLAIVATFVTGVFGAIFMEGFKSARGSIFFVAFMWLLTGTFLLITDYRKRTRVGLREFGITAAVLVGLAQAVAIMPGVSRSGATICAAILLGLHRRWAVEFSFMLAIPAIAGAVLIQIITDYENIASGSLGFDVMLFGGLASFFVGVASLKLLIKLSRKSRLKYFAFYCFLLAIAVLIVLTLR